MDSVPNKKSAQQRIDLIQAFHRELDNLESEDVLHLPEESKQAVKTHHDHLIREFGHRFDTDSSDAERKLSLGMRILTFLGGFALCASIFYFFYQIWGLIPESAQIALVIATPILAVIFLKWSGKKDPSFYYASLVGLVAFVGFILNLRVMGSLYNITPTQNAFLAWGLFSVILAYYMGLRLLLLVGLLSILGYISATVGAWSGIYWLNFGERPENFIFSGAIMFALPLIFRHREYYGFTWFYHLVGLLSINIALLIMSYCGRCSYILGDHNVIEITYQTIGFSFFGITAWLGVRAKYSGVTNIGVTFLTLFLYTKFFDWWWEAVPKYLFFFIVSLITIGLLVLFRKFRSQFREAI